jgi:hypothetical protein
MPNLTRGTSILSVAPYTNDSVSSPSTVIVAIVPTPPVVLRAQDSCGMVPLTGPAAVRLPEKRQG